MKGATAISEAHFGIGLGDIFLDDVTCTGVETELLSCTSNLIGIHNCYHGKDAGVFCEGDGVSLPSA